MIAKQVSFVIKFYSLKIHHEEQQQAEIQECTFKPELVSNPEPFPKPAVVANPVDNMYFSQGKYYFCFINAFYSSLF